MKLKILRRKVDKAWKMYANTLPSHPDFKIREKNFFKLMEQVQKALEVYSRDKGIRLEKVADKPAEQKPTLKAGSAITDIRKWTHYYRFKDVINVAEEPKKKASFFKKSDK